MYIIFILLSIVALVIGAAKMSAVGENNWFQGLEKGWIIGVTLLVVFGLWIIYFLITKDFHKLPKPLIGLASVIFIIVGTVIYIRVADNISNQKIKNEGNQSDHAYLEKSLNLPNNPFGGGIAQNSGKGAELLYGADTIYVSGLKEWPANLNNKYVMTYGLLTKNGEAYYIVLSKYEIDERYQQYNSTH